jgi:multicomponent Na+:H+ antiporter subunit E
MSGYYDLIHLSMGAFSVALVLFTNYKLKTHRFFKDDMSDLKELRFHMAFAYIFWLLWQMIMSGLHVAKILISPQMPVNLQMVTFKVDLPSAHARMILGNSITLTPGTLTIDIVGNEFTVHGIDERSFAGIINDEMPRKVLKLFLNEERQVISDIKYIRD